MEKLVNHWNDWDGAGHSQNIWILEMSTRYTEYIQSLVRTAQTNRVYWCTISPTGVKVKVVYNSQNNIQNAVHHYHYHALTCPGVQI